MHIVLLGSGNVASHLGNALHNAGHHIKQVWSRNIDHAYSLANVLDSEGTDRFDNIITDADVYIVAVVDDVIEDIIRQLPIVSGCIVHTSGSTDLAIIPPSIKRYGVFYPLQTFSIGKEINFTTTPILLEASDKGTLKVLIDLARSISERVQECNSARRRTLHIAAVFSCNFSNHLYVIAQHLLEEEGLDFDLLRPLIQETSEKIQENLPSEVQTGPAKRNDRNTLDRHCKQLTEHPDWLTIYRIISQAIVTETGK